MPEGFGLPASTRNERFNRYVMHHTLFLFLRYHISNYIRCRIRRQL